MKELLLKRSVNILNEMKFPQNNKLFSSPVFLFILIALLYFIPGRLGLLMALPPGYATAVWPPSGIALAGLLIFGYRYWPAVWLGSFLVNIWTSLNLFDTSAFFNGLVPALLIGLGASLQSLAGAFLINRAIGTEITLVKEKEVFKFLILGGPVSCLIAATVGISTLVNTGAIKPESALLSWWTWWVGDSIGVMIFAPLTMMVFAKPVNIWRSRLLSVGLPMILFFALTVFLFVFMKNTEQKRIAEIFMNQGRLLANALENNVQRHMDVLYSMQSFFNSSKDVERLEFSSFASNILDRYKAFAALEWDPVITRETRDAFEQEVRREGFPDFEIKEKTEQGEFIRAPERDIYFPITYAEPMELNKKVLGFDFMSDQSRREALRLAWESGELAMTRPVDLIQGPKGVVAFLAIYKEGNFPALIEERKNNLQGFVVVVFEINDIIQSSFERLDYQDFILSVDDLDPLEGELSLYENSKKLNESGPSNVYRGFEFSREMSLGGRTWRLKAHPTNNYFIKEQSWTIWFILAGSLLFIGFLGNFLLIITGREFLISLLIEERTEQLKQANEKMQREIAERKQIEESLKAHNQELERFNDAVLGREERIIELKKEINGLSQQLGLQPPYDMSFLKKD